MVVIQLAELPKSSVTHNVTVLRPISSQVKVILSIGSFSQKLNVTGLPQGCSLFKSNKNGNMQALSSSGIPSPVRSHGSNATLNPVLQIAIGSISFPTIISLLHVVVLPHKSEKLIIAVWVPIGNLLLKETTLDTRQSSKSIVPSLFKSILRQFCICVPGVQSSFAVTVNCTSPVSHSSEIKVIESQSPA